jgi:KDO2-lipid IV(A) lauroyltransferase
VPAHQPSSPPPAPPHAPETGWARRLLGRFHVTGVFWYRLHGWGGAHWPSSLMWLMVGLFTSFFFLTLYRIRIAVAHNLEPVLGHAGWIRRQVRAYRTMWNFAWCLTERYERLVSTRPFTVETDDLPRWRELCDAGEGFILVTAHLGSWEVGAMLPATAVERPVHVVREAEGDPQAQEYVSELMRRQQGAAPHITHFAEDPQLGMLLLDALRRGEIVALQGDRPRAGGKSATVTLFGRPFPLPLGPAALARAAGVPLVPVFVFRGGRRRFSCQIRPPIRVAATADRDADLRQCLQSLAAELERAITHRPYQWFCFRRLW